ncbi:hypothetical protein [Acinetobacter sp.]|jgi:type VI secretion system secreted protein VgrG|uniref:hypothetical protein n=1 Tax=Acinetobacter sp. TaxID=472 RepID=UPI0035B018BC
MFNTIAQILEQFGLGAQKRAIHARFSNPALHAQVFVQRIDGQHAINDGVQMQLICLSTQANIPLKQHLIKDFSHGIMGLILKIIEI